MYSGITQGLFSVSQLQAEPGLLNYRVQLNGDLCQGLKPGDSVAVDGVCQTVVSIENAAVHFQAIQETLDKTTLKSLKLHQLVSIERSLRYGDEIGGHEVSGHVYGTAKISCRQHTSNNLCLTLSCPIDWMKYIVEKGFIAIDGSSLTVGDTCQEKGQFQLHLIPETLRLTNLGNKQVGDSVNVEFEAKTKTLVDSLHSPHFANLLRKLISPSLEDRSPPDL